MSSQIITQNDLKQILNQVLPPDNVDYVVSQGTDGIWTYRKWNSGIAECWGSILVHPSITTQYGSLYIANLGATNFVNGLFTSRPNIFGSVDLAGGVGGVTFTGITSTGFSTAYVFNGQTYNATARDVYVSMHVIGTWK